MRYSFEKISTAASCETLLASAQKKKQSLERKRRNLGESIDTFRGRMNQISKESALVQSSLEAFTAAYEALPDGKDRASMKVKIKRLELRQAQLEKKTYTCNVAILLVKEMKYNRLDSQVSAIDEYIAAVERTKTILGNAPVRVNEGATVLRSPAARFPFQDLLQGHLPPRTYVKTMRQIMYLEASRLKEIKPGSYDYARLAWTDFSRSRKLLSQFSPDPGNGRLQEDQGQPLREGVA
jgi:prefoldin subunit 5